LEYTWVQIGTWHDTWPDITLLDPTTEEPLTMPTDVPNPVFYVPDFSGINYDGQVKATFQVTATEKGGNGQTSAAESVVVTINRKPVPVIVLKRDGAAVSGEPMLNVGDVITLDGSGSYDPDGPANKIDLTYEWFVSNTSSGAGMITTAHLSPDNEAEAPTFAAPAGLADVGAHPTVTFGLKVTGTLGTEKDSASLEAPKISINRRPIADAGKDQTVDAGDTVTLDATGSDDPDGDEIVEYAWEKILGPEGVPMLINKATPSFTAPEVDEVTDVTFRLTVKDEYGLESVNSDGDSDVTIKINPVSSNILIVDQNAKDPLPRNVYNTITDAVAAAVDGNEIEVRAGTYAEDVDLSVKSGIVLRSEAWRIACENDYLTLPNKDGNIEVSSGPLAGTTLNGAIINGTVTMGSNTSIKGFKIVSTSVSKSALTIDRQTDVEVAYNTIKAMAEVPDSVLRALEIKFDTGVAEDIDIHNNVIMTRARGEDCTGLGVAILHKEKIANQKIRLINNSIDVISEYYGHGLYIDADYYYDHGAADLFDSVGIAVRNNIITIEPGVENGGNYCVYRAGIIQQPDDLILLRYNCLYVRPNRHGIILGESHPPVSVNATEYPATGNMIWVGDAYGRTEKNGNIIFRAKGREWVVYPKIYADLNDPHLAGEDFHISEESFPEIGEIGFGCIDTGYPADDSHHEPDGSRINMGAYGNTKEATEAMTGGNLSPYAAPPMIVNPSDGHDAIPDDVSITFEGCGFDKDEDGIAAYEWTIIGPEVEYTFTTDVSQFIYDLSDQEKLPVGHYIVTLRVQDDSEEGKWSAPSKPTIMGIGRPDEVTPGASPRGESISLSFCDTATTEDNIVIERRESGTRVWDVVTTLPGDNERGAKAWDDTYINPQATYYYRVKAIRNNAESASGFRLLSLAPPSTAASIEVCSEPVVAHASSDYPIAPHGLTASIITNSDRNITTRLSWSQSDAVSVDGYKVYRSVNDDSSFRCIADDVTRTIYDDTDITTATTYYYKVVACNSIGDSSYSDAADIHVPENVPPTVTIVSPESGASIFESTTVTIKINDVEEDEVAVWLEYRKGNGGWQRLTYLVTAFKSMEFAWDVSSLEPGTDYQLRVRGTDRRSSMQHSFDIVGNLTVNVPIPLFTVDPVSGSVPLAVTFDASTSKGDIKYYLWNFGDGNWGSGVTVTHTYTDVGIFTVTLTVYGDDVSASADTTVEVSNQPPSIEVPGLFINIVNVGQNFECTLNVDDTEKHNVDVTYDELPTGATFDASTLVFAWMPTYAQAGRHGVTFTATDEYGGSSSDTLFIFVNRPPLFTPITPEPIYEEEPLAFTLDVSDPDGHDFHVNAEPATMPAAATFNPETLAFDWTPNRGQAGDYNIVFEATDRFNATSTLSVPITVNGLNDPPHITVSATPPYVVNENELLELELLVSDSNGDAVVEMIPKDPPIGSTLEPVDGTEGVYLFKWIPTYEQQGEYRIEFTAEDEHGAITDISVVIQVIDVILPLTAEFTATPTSGDAPLTVQFTDESIPADTITSWSWEFGDGHTSEDQSPEHTFEKPGMYKIKLTVTDDAGKVAYKEKVAYIVATPLAIFSAAPNKQEPCQPIKFESKYSIGDIVAWEWDFGDGKTSTEPSPTHAYSEIGNYSVSLTVTTESGAKHTLTYDNYITITDLTPPRVTITSPPDNSGVSDPDGYVTVEGIIQERDLATAEITVQGTGDWMPLTLTSREPPLDISGTSYEFTASIRIPFSGDGRMEVIRVRATDGAGRTSSDSIRVLRGYVRFIPLPEYYSSADFGRVHLSSMAAAMDILKLIRFEPDDDFPQPADLWQKGHEYGLPENHKLAEFDPQGMQGALDYFDKYDSQHPDRWSGYAFKISDFDSSHEGFLDYLTEIVRWMSYPTLKNYREAPPYDVEVGDPQWFTHEPYVPVLAPMLADVSGYSRWIVINGCAADIDPYADTSAPWCNWDNYNRDITVYGLFLTDPKPEVFGGFGRDVYVVASELEEYYLKPLPTRWLDRRYGYREIVYRTETYYATGYGTGYGFVTQTRKVPVGFREHVDKYSGRYVMVSDPPPPIERSVEEPTGMASIAEPTVNASTLALLEIAEFMNSDSVDDFTRHLVDAALAVNLDESEAAAYYSTYGDLDNLFRREINIEQFSKFSWKDVIDPSLLANNDFRDAIDKTTVQEFIKVHRPDTGRDYYIIPFDKHQEGRFGSCAAIMIDAEDGHFIQATCVGEPIRYVQATKEDVIGKLVELYPNAQIDAQLVWEPGGKSLSPFYPYWEITVDGKKFTVKKRQQ